VNPEVNNELTAKYAIKVLAMAAGRHLVAAHLQELAFDIHMMHTDKLRDAQSMR